MRLAAQPDLGRYAGLVLDLDGVVLLGGQAIPGAAAAVGRVRAAGCGVVFATNNATRTAAQVVAVLAEAGVAASESEVVTSSMAAAEMVEPGTRCFVIGMAGLHEPLAARGAVVVRDPALVQAVVVGLDRTFTYEDLRLATHALRRGARFLATNTDRTFPAPEGLEPGAGALVAALVAASDRDPEVAGKPHPPLYATAALHLPDGPLLMVGDRLDTDIDGATALGWDTALVLTGVTTLAAAAAASPPPTYVAPSLADLIP